MTHTFGATPWPEIEEVLQRELQETRGVYPGFGEGFHYLFSLPDMKMWLQSLVVGYDHAGLYRPDLGLWCREQRRIVLEPRGIVESV